ncbi:MAG: FMN-dependent NADH-azoreductase [candidate division TM6 bacterium GW2011_GWF2_30_66]|nr:MAG: FMN-dependent NADH-azoreductase [candidate division TM6 bacterium GW2011_GWF2_30_66]
MKILVVSYLPSLQNSRTKNLLDTFVESVKNKENIETLDLLKDMPDFITPEILQAYVHRNYMGQNLKPEQEKYIAKLDKMTEQFKSADVVVIAYPMYNFSVPSMVKAYFDSVMLKGETFDTGAKGFVGLMAGKKALILTSSGGVYEGEYAKYDFSTTLTKYEFEFMGFSDIKIVKAQGLNMKSTDVAKVIEVAQQEVKKIVGDWNL